MAGLGRGIGSLISESNNKKAKQQEQNAKTLGQSLLERSLSSPKPATDPAEPQSMVNAQAHANSQANVNAQAKADNEPPATASKSAKTISSSSTKAKAKAATKKATTSKTTQAKTTAKKTSAKAKSKASQEQAPQEPSLVEHAPALATAPAPSNSPKSSKSPAKKKAANTVDATDATASAATAATTAVAVTEASEASTGKSKVKKATTRRKATKDNQATLEDTKLNSSSVSSEATKGEVATGTGDAIKSELGYNDENEVGALAKDVALAQSMQDAMELSYLAENGLNEGKVANDIELVSASSDDHLVLNVKLDMLMPSTYQPRHSFDDEAIKELATSIKEHGLLEPLIVKRIDGGKYEIICGERRYRAARMLSMASVPCLVREVVDEKAYAIALIENIQRENLNPVELAIAFDQMMQECGMTQEEVAKSVCKSRSAVANYLRVLKLEDGSLAALKAGKIDLGHAKVLLSLSGSAQNEACQIVIERGLSVRATESFVKEFAKKLEARALEEAQSNTDDSSSESHRNINYTSYEKSLNAKLKGVKAKFKVSKDGKGKLTFSYDNDKQLDSLLTLLGLDKSN